MCLLRLFEIEIFGKRELVMQTKVDIFSSLKTYQKLRAKLDAIALKKDDENFVLEQEAKLFEYEVPSKERLKEFATAINGIIKKYEKYRLRNRLKRGNERYTFNF